MTTTRAIKGDPYVVSAKTVDTRAVSLRLGNCSRMTDGTGNLFMPKELALRWQGGRLQYAMLGGRSLRADGHEFLGARGASITYYADDPETPVWVSQLISEHAPA